MTTENLVYNGFVPLNIIIINDDNQPEYATFNKLTSLCKTWLFLSKIKEYAWFYFLT